MGVRVCWSDHCSLVSELACRLQRRTNLQLSFVQAIWGIDEYIVVCARCYLPGCFTDSNGLELVAIAMRYGLNEVIGAAENDKCIARNVSLHTISRGSLAQRTCRSAYDDALSLPEDGAEGL